MNSMWKGVVEDFSDIGGPEPFVRLLVRLLLAALLGGLLGYERAKAGKDAGVRTHMLISLGAAVFVAIAGQAGMGTDSLSRVLQGLVAGIGFIGAGGILRTHHEEGPVRGLTTAAGIWLTAGVGVAAGLGRGTSAVLVAMLALSILFGVRQFERWAGGRKEGDGDKPGGDGGPTARRGKGAV